MPWGRKTGSGGSAVTAQELKPGERTGGGRRCDICTGTRFRTNYQATVAGILELETRQVRIHTMFAGGGFGRRATPTADCLANAARVMKV